MLDLIVRYVGDINGLAEEIGFQAEELLGGYAIVRIRQELAPLLLSAEEILWTEVPARVYTEVANGRREACVTALQARNPGLTGRGVLVAIIDSGIDYTHPDFRNADGTTRIAALWDQTAGSRNGTVSEQDPERPTEVISEGGSRYPEIPPEGYLDGVLYTRERLNAALQGEQTVDDASLVPESDLSGHGTHVAGIAAGNGRASGGRYRGVAYESELLVVKLGGTQADPFPQTTNLMSAVDFCVRYAAKAGLPLSINLSFGNNEGAHDGQSLLETYLDTVALYGKTCICIGTGNNAALGRHVGGTFLREGRDGSESGGVGQNAGRPEPDESAIEREILLSVGPAERSIRIGLWLSGLDRVAVSFVSPTGEVLQLPMREVMSEGRRGEDGAGIGARGGTAIKGYPAAVGEVLDFGDSVAEVFVGETTPYRMLREIGITLRGTGGPITEGTWRIRLRPVRILDGAYDGWIEGEVQSTVTRFLQATPERTLTIPSTAGRPIAVAAYDGRTDSITNFSGRGYPRGAYENSGIKPDVAAPGVEIVSCAPGGGYTTKTGTSMATPFVTGCAALLMQWGITEENDPYLYGERMKSFLIRGANPLTGVSEVPNPYVGWGTVCAEESYRLLV